MQELCRKFMFYNKLLKYKQISYFIRKIISRSFAWIALVYLVYSMYVQWLFNDYSMFIKCLFNVYSMSIQCLFNVYSMSLQCLSNVHSMYIWWTFNVLQYSHFCLNGCSLSYPNSRDAIASKKRSDYFLKLLNLEISNQFTKES